MQLLLFSLLCDQRRKNMMRFVRVEVKILFIVPMVFCTRDMDVFCPSYLKNHNINSIRTSVVVCPSDKVLIKIPHTRTRILRYLCSRDHFRIPFKKRSPNAFSFIKIIFGSCERFFECPPRRRQSEGEQPSLALALTVREERQVKCGPQP